MSKTYRFVEPLLVLSLNRLQERQSLGWIHSSLTQLKRNISIWKTHWLAQDLRKVKFRWSRVSSWHHIILRETSFYFCIERGGKNLTLVCFLLLLKRETKNVWRLQPISSVWRPLAFLPVPLSQGPVSHCFFPLRLTPPLQIPAWGATACWAFS